VMTMSSTIMFLASGGIVDYLVRKEEGPEPSTCMRMLVETARGPETELASVRVCIRMMIPENTESENRLQAFFGPLKADDAASHAVAYSCAIYLLAKSTFRERKMAPWRPWTGSARRGSRSRTRGKISPQPHTGGARLLP
ncbi:hypothetical protein LCGC14_0728110, partial [marine sediment metagenome]